MTAKRIFDIIFSLLFLIIFAPLLVLTAVMIKLSSKGPFIFKQKRMGRMKKEFTIYKFRTMVVGAEKKKAGLVYLNETDGPVFKIYNDPRFTTFGRYLAYTGLDELPQLINVLKGEMSLVGPRPLPVDEAEKVPKEFEKRFAVLPGITSEWVIEGAHNLSFKKWMELDLEYVKKQSFTLDIGIMAKTVFNISKWILRMLI